MNEEVGSMSTSLLESPFTIQNEIARKAFNRLGILFSKKNLRPDGTPIEFQGNCVGIELWLRNESPHVVAAGFLHEVLNENVMTPEEVEKEFGVSVRALIENVSYASQELFEKNPHEAWMEVLKRVEDAGCGPILIMCKALQYKLKFIGFLDSMGVGRKQLYEQAKRCLEVGRRRLLPTHYAVIDLQAKLKKVEERFADLHY